MESLLVSHNIPFKLESNTASESDFKRIDGYIRLRQTPTVTERVYHRITTTPRVLSELPHGVADAFALYGQLHIITVDIRHIVVIRAPMGTKIKKSSNPIVWYLIGDHVETSRLETFGDELSEDLSEFISMAMKRSLISFGRTTLIAAYRNLFDNICWPKLSIKEQESIIPKLTDALSRLVDETDERISELFAKEDGHTKPLVESDGDEKMVEKETEVKEKLDNTSGILEGPMRAHAADVVDDIRRDTH